MQTHPQIVPGEDGSQLCARSSERRGQALELRFAGQLFEIGFRLERGGPVFHGPQASKFHWTPPAGIFRPRTGVVLFQATREVVGDAAVQGSVVTTEHVEEPAIRGGVHGTIGTKVARPAGYCVRR